MQKNKFVRILGLSFAVLSLFGAGNLEAAESLKGSRPNIILLMGDDHGWEEVGYNGHPYVMTPYLDEMAKAGLRMDNFYAQPSCSPTRGNILTGRHPNRFGIVAPGYSIRPKEITVAQLLSGAGYSTGHFGKWHVNPLFPLLGSPLQGISRPR
jgi:arylsulfatase A-like enzyme